MAQVESKQTAAQEVAPSQVAPSQVAQRAIESLVVDGTRWMDKRGCVSCHQIPAMIWSLNAAKEYGLSIPDELSEWNSWSTNVVNFVKPEQKQDVDVDIAPQCMEQMIATDA